MQNCPRSLFPLAYLIERRQGRNWSGTNSVQAQGTVITITMALPLGKLVIVVGAGIAGSVLVNEGRISRVSDFFSGAFKVVLKHLKDDGSSSKENSIDNSLMAQVNNLRQELNRLASSRPITVVTGNSQSGTTTYAAPVIIVGVAGYGYIWWKGWKLSDMMFATKRSLSDACVSVGKQLEQVSASISAAKRHLSSRIDRVDNNLDQCAELNAATKDEEFKIGRIEDKQDLTNLGVYELCQFVRTIEERKQAERVQISFSSKQAIEHLNSTSSPGSCHQASSSKPQLAIEFPGSASSSSSSFKGSSSSPRTPEQRIPVSCSAAGLKEVQGMSVIVEPSSPHIFETKECEVELKGHFTNLNAFGRKIPGLGAAFLQRSRSATCSFNKGLSSKP
ncbi:uncharacterized protein LOC131067529 isoform X2 [Cryptomeria japonica]|uniref:uncharacterized protein LOC131067529 isoform X2 n=1 Tax=Cryptomeria japonica TaxID=3369 RepID=UPI0027DA7512|nr:uncharacterized protein LOC131067529 isoform X2 [Cryptomeria japonica]